MGMPLFSEGVVTAPNPNPKNFHIIASCNFGDYSVVEVYYPGCTPYGGKKILVYKSSIESINRQLELDPHFLESGLSPIARFPASSQGRADAIDFARWKYSHA